MKSWKHLMAIMAAVVIVFATAGATFAGGVNPTLPSVPGDLCNPGGPQGPGPGCGPKDPGHHGHRYAVIGVITHIEQAGDEGSLLVTIDRGVVDDNPKDDVQVLVTDDTHVIPPGDEPEVGLEARAMVTGDEEPYTAYHLMLGERRDPGHGQGHHRPLHACGTITELPEGEDLLGSWKIDVHHGDEYEIEVTADTEITPPDVQPEVGWPVCFSGHESDEGWVADHVQLSHGFGPGPHRAGHHQIVIRGTVVGNPANDPNHEWTLTIDVIGADAKDVLVRPDTEIMGELIENASVTVHAWRADDGQLVAQTIMVTSGHQGPGHPGRGARDAARVLVLASWRSMSSSVISPRT